MKRNVDHMKFWKSTSTHIFNRKSEQTEENRYFW